MLIFLKKNNGQMNFLFNFITEIIPIVPTTRLVFKGSSEIYF